MRSLYKTGSYAVMHLIVAIAVGYGLTGDLFIALSIGLLEPAVQTLFFALHKRLWEGKKPKGEATGLSLAAR